MNKDGGKFLFILNAKSFICSAIDVEKRSAFLHAGK